MAFRSIEISHDSEIHVRKGLLNVTQENKNVYIPIEDIAVIICIGPNIRISTLGITQLAKCGVMILTIDEKYRPAAMIMPCEENSRQALLMQKQVQMSKSMAGDLWKSIVQGKIENQSRALSMLGIDGAVEIGEYVNRVEDGDVTNMEAVAAKEYFLRYHPGLNRRTDDPINSCLNYGYAVIRSAITRSLICAGFHTSLGIHHHSQLNAFNLADDVIEPWRAAVDVIAHQVVSSNFLLTKNQRQQLASVLHNACMINGEKMSILSGIDIMVESLKRSVLENENRLLIPILQPVEEFPRIKE